MEVSIYYLYNRTYRYHISVLICVRVCHGSICIDPPVMYPPGWYPDVFSGMVHLCGSAADVSACATRASNGRRMRRCNRRATVSTSCHLPARVCHTTATDITLIPVIISLGQSLLGMRVRNLELTRHLQLLSTQLSPHAAGSQARTDDGPQMLSSPGRVGGSVWGGGGGGGSAPATPDASVVRDLSVATPSSFAPRKMLPISRNSDSGP